LVTPAPVVVVVELVGGAACARLFFLNFLPIIINRRAKIIPMIDRPIKPTTNALFQVHAPKIIEKKTYRE